MSPGPLAADVSNDQKTIGSTVRMLRKVRGVLLVGLCVSVGFVPLSAKQLPSILNRDVGQVQRGASEGNADDEAVLGMMYLGGGPGVTPDHDAAVEWLKKAATDGSSTAAFALGSISGGDPRGSSEGFRWFMMAAARGNASAQLRVALALEKGAGTEKDLNAALTWYWKAAESGDGSATNLLAEALCRIGSDEDCKQAFALYQMSADRNNANAAFRLAGMYETGSGVNKDLTTAIRYYGISADQGETRAQHRLGQCLVDGCLDHKVDMVEGLKWLELAAALHPDGDFETARDRALALADRKQIDQAVGRAESWLDGLFARVKLSTESQDARDAVAGRLVRQTPPK